VWGRCAHRQPLQTCAPQGPDSDAHVFFEQGKASSSLAEVRSICTLPPNVHGACPADGRGRRMTARALKRCGARMNELQPCIRAPVKTRVGRAFPPRSEDFAQSLSAARLVRTSKGSSPRLLGSRLYKRQVSVAGVQEARASGQPDVAMGAAGKWADGDSHAANMEALLVAALVLGLGAFM